MSKAKNYGDLLAMGVVRRPHPPRLAGRGARSPLFLLLRKPVRLGPGVVMRQKRHEWDNLVAGHNGTARGEGTARRNRFRPDCRSGSVTSEYITCVSPNPRRQECCVERESLPRGYRLPFFFPSVFPRRWSWCSHSPRKADYFSCHRSNTAYADADHLPCCTYRQTVFPVWLPRPFARPAGVLVVPGKSRYCRTTRDTVVASSSRASRF